MATGVRHLTHTAALRHMVLGIISAILVFGFSESVFFAFVDQGLHRPPAFLAVIVCIQGIGGLLGGLSAARLVCGVGEIGTAAIGVTLLLPMLITSLWPNTWFVFPACPT